MQVQLFCFFKLVLRFVDYAGPSKTLLSQATTFFITMMDDVVGVAHSSSDGLLASEDDDEDESSHLVRQNLQQELALPLF